MQICKASKGRWWLSLFSVSVSIVFISQSCLAGELDDLKTDVSALKKKLEDIQSQLTVQNKVLSGSREDIAGIRQLLLSNPTGRKPRPAAMAAPIKKNARKLNPSRHISKASIKHVQPADLSTFELPGEASNFANKIHFLIYSYSVNDGTISEGAQANAGFLTSLAIKFKEFDSDRVSIAPVTALFSETTIVNDINALSVAPEDAIFCYMSTHGTYSETAGHSVLMNDGTTVVPRSNIFKSLKSKNARLTVFITDSCSNFPPVGSAGFPTASTHPTAATYPLRDLLYKFVGDLNMNGASPDPSHVNADGTQGEEGWYLKDSSNAGGGIATRAFIKEAVFGKSTNWVEFYDNWSSSTAAEGQAVPTPKQTPAVFNQSGIWVH